MEDILKVQREFERAHGLSWEGLPLAQRQEKLQFAIIALAEELGEIAGPVKKALRRTRGTLTQEDFEELREKLNEEVVDVFLYTLKLSMLLDMDFKKSVLEKIAKNYERDRFKQLRQS